MKKSAAWLKFIQALPIRTRDRRIAPLMFNTPQRMVWQHIAPKLDRGEPIWLIILKARREGVSTEVEALLFTFIVMHDLVNAMVMAHQAKAARRIWQMSSRFVTASAALSSMVRVGTTAITAGSSSLEISTAGSPDAERAADITAAHFSEFAFYDTPDVMDATLQTIPDDPSVQTMAIIESTANGKTGRGKMFYDEWGRAVAGKSGFTPVFLAFQDFPDYRLPGAAVEDYDDEEKYLVERFAMPDAVLAWRRATIAKRFRGNVTKFHQEFPASADEAFIASGLPFFQLSDLLPMERTLRPGVRFRLDAFGGFHRDPEGPLEMFAAPKAGHSYVIGANCSMGVADDDEDGDDEHETGTRAAAEVLDMETMEQVAEYDGATPPHLFAKHLAALGRKYHDALIANEISTTAGGGGRELIVYLREAGYWNLHRWRGRPDEIVRGTPHVFGWETNQRTWPRMVARMVEAVMERTATIRSRALYDQLKDFGEVDAQRFLDAYSGETDLMVSWATAILSRSENYSEPIPSPDLPMDWRALGIRVQQWETADQRLKRVLATERPARGRSFLEV